MVLHYNYTQTGVTLGRRTENPNRAFETRALDGEYLPKKSIGDMIYITCYPSLYSHIYCY
jgi:hypothetical protein